MLDVCSPVFLHRDTLISFFMKINIFQFDVSCALVDLTEIVLETSL